ncbi:hypothetical protein M728_005772 (plasmid) [Ensifer sp. WSM1721]|uniref:hypothetical protein n=1 Tax=Ensifer sp. WSM1721 TaxID=1041159 RepID=UPI0005520428|nr:hypothetical protein [Ensifer sp. WSM1721]
MRYYAALAATAVFASSCATRPLPEDVTRLNTYAIVTKIRCEARDAVFSELLAYLKDTSRNVSPHIISEIEKDPSIIAQFDRRRLPVAIRKKVDLYANAAIVYDFNFDMSQHSTNSLGATLNDTWSSGFFNLGISGTNERTRRNQRQFRVEDTFYKLFTNPPRCEPYSKNGKFERKRNYAYPITGYIGIQEIVDTFWRLNEDHILGNADSDQPKVNKLADEIEFTTKNKFSVTPHAELDPASHLKIVVVDAESTNWREDIHTVTIGIAVQDEEVEPAELRDRGRPTRRPSRAASAIKNANEAINELQFRNMQIFNRNDLQQLLPSF